MRWYLSILYLLIIGSSAIAETYHVGDMTALNNAIDDVVPGDTIEMQDGLWLNSLITFDANGTAADPIVLIAQNPGQVILSGATRFRIGGDYLIVSGLIFEDCTAVEGNLISFRKSSSDLANYSRLTNCVIKNCNPTDPTENYKWVGLYGSYNELDHCLIENKNHEGACVVVWSNENEAHHHIHHNYFGASPEGDGNGWETIRIGTSSWAQYDGYSLVEHNYFYKRDGEIEIISGKSSNCTYQYNIFKECKGGLTLRHGTDCTVKGNIFLGEHKSGTYGVRIIDRDHTVINNHMQDLNHGSSSYRHPIVMMGGETNPAANGYQHNINNNISYNTIVNCTKGIMIDPDNDHPVPPDSCVIANNVIDISNAPPVIHNTDPTNATYVGNFFYRSDDDVTVPSTGYQDVDPELSIPLGDSLYRPSSVSPLIASAVMGWSIEYEDFESQSRSSSPTVGADEISSDPIIDRGVYGPTWMTTDQGQQSSFLIEAEDATWGAQWTLVVDSLACGSKFLLPPSMSSVNTPPTGPEDLVSFSFSLSEGGTYKVYARTITSAGSDDSFWVRANDGDWQKWNTINGPNYPGGYLWSQVGNWVEGDTAVPVTFEMDAGTNIVNFAWRESEARLDKIFVTKEDLSVLNLVRNNNISDIYSLRYTIENACPLDTIFFADSTDNIAFPVDSNTIEINDPLTVIGNGETLTAIDGQGLYPILVNNSDVLNIKNITFYNAYSLLNGGAILNNGNITLESVVFQNNFEGTLHKALTNNGNITILSNGLVQILK